MCPKFPAPLRCIDRADFFRSRNFVAEGGVLLFFRYLSFCLPHAREQYTELAEQTGWLTSLYALGRSLLNFGIEVLEIEEMEAWRRFELGRNLRAGQDLH